MGKKRRSILIISVIVLALLVVKAVFFFTAKPKVTVNYVAEYNLTACPQNYDPNDNAASYYQKAFDTFVKMPHELRIPYMNWPTDYNSVNQGKLKEWLASNSQAFECFKIAADKPYYWLKRQAKGDDNMFNIVLPELSTFRELSRALIWNAKLNVVKGQFQPAFENILSCYRAGSHKCRPSLLLVDQHNGLGIKEEATKNAFIILNKSEVESKALKFFQDALHVELTEDTYVPDVRAEKLALFDALQRTFIYNGKGTGRLAWRAANGLTPLCGGWYNFKVYLSCFIGPTRNQVVEQIEQVFDICAQLKSQTPWQLKNQDADYFKRIDTINNSNFLLSAVGINPESTFNFYHKTRAQTKALIAVLAVLRFKIDTGQFPESLDKLVSTDYLESIPMDPYSDGPLVYKLTEDNFKLYSFGEDFSDDGGVIEVKTKQESWFGETNIISYVHSPDIVYWPVKRLERPHVDESKDANTAPAQQ